MNSLPPFLKNLRSRLPRKVVEKLAFFSPKVSRRIVVNFTQTSVEAGCFEISIGGAAVTKAPVAARLTAVEVQKVISTNDDAVIAGFLENFLRKNGIQSADAIVNILDRRAFYVRNMTIASVPAEEMREAIRWQLKDEVPFELETAAVQWRVLSNFNEDDGAAKTELLVVVAHRPLIDRVLALVANVHLNPVRVTHGFSNFENLLSGAPGDHSCLAILEIDREEILFGFFKDKKLAFVRKFPFSGEKLTRSLTDTLVSDEGEFRLTYTQAQEIKKKVGIPLDESQVFEGGVQGKVLISLMRPILEVLVRELRFSLDYLVSNFDLSRQSALSTGVPSKASGEAKMKDVPAEAGSPRPAENKGGTEPAPPMERRFDDRRPTILYLTGEESGLKNLDVYLKRALQLDLVSLSTLLPAGDLDLARGREDTVLALRSAIGAGDEAFDFLPQEFRKQKRLALRTLSLRYVLIVLAGVFVLLSALSFSEMVKLNGKIRDIKQSSSMVDQITTLGQKIYVRESLVKRIRFNRVPSEGVLKLLGTLIPREIILGELTYDQAGHLVSLTGAIVADQEHAGEILTQFMQRLRASIYFKEVQFVSAKSLGQVQGFELKCYLSSRREP